MIFSGIKPLFPPQMLDELIFVPEVVWTYLWQINFFSPEILKVPLGTGLLKSKKKRLPPTKNVLRTTPVEGLSSWTVHGLSNLFMNCSWTCSNCCSEYLDISRLLNIFWTCSWTVPVKKKLKFTVRVTVIYPKDVTSILESSGRYGLLELCCTIIKFSCRWFTPVEK